MDVFYDELRIAIVEQAVKDYMQYAKQIKELQTDIEKVVINIIMQDQKLKNPRNYTYKEAELVRQNRIHIKKTEMQEVEKFFNSPWYKQLCKIDSDCMVKRIREMAIEQYGVDIKKV